MKQEILNRKGEKIIVLYEEKYGSTQLAFVMHGLGGFKEQAGIRAFIQSFLDNNISVISFDTSNTFGESDGNYEDATLTNYYEDLEDVIVWAKNQKYYSQPFYLAGHSLGGISIILYTLKYPSSVKALAPISTVVSGKLSLEIMDQKAVKLWKKNGIMSSESKSKPGVIKKLKYSHVEDRVKYDILSEAKDINIPVLLIVGDKDTITPLEHQKLLLNELNCNKELHIIKGAGHTFRQKEHLEEISSLFDEWIKNTNKK